MRIGSSRRATLPGGREETYMVQVNINLSAESRAVGCLLGLACGDAVGTTVEFKPRGSFEPVTDMVGGGPFRLLAGRWTDDTIMALCMAESLLACDGFDATDQLSRYLRWYREGVMSPTGRCVDIGVTTERALRRFERTGDPDSGDSDPQSAGNGSIMRLAPAVLFAHPDSSAVANLSAASSRTTHGATEAVEASEGPGAWATLPLLIGFLFLIAGVILRQLTKKTATSSFMVFTPAGPVWGIVEYDLPKTPQELAADQTFFARFLPIFPLLLIEGVTLMVMMNIKAQHTDQATPRFLFSFALMVASWVGIYWGVVALQQWAPRGALRQAVRGGIIGLVFAPMTIFLTLFVLGCVDAQLYLLAG